LYKKNFSFLSLKRKIRGADLENVSQILFMEISTELCFLESILESFMGIEVLLTQNLTTHAQYRTNASKKQSWVPMAIKKGTFFDCRRKERGGGTSFNLLPFQNFYSLFSTCPLIKKSI